MTTTPCLHPRVNDFGGVYVLCATCEARIKKPEITKQDRIVRELNARLDAAKAAPHA